MHRSFVVVTGILALVSTASFSAAELLGSPLRINVNETNDNRTPNAATNGVDRTLVVYRGSTPNYGGIIGQFFDLAGHAVTGEFIAMDYPVGTPFEQAYGFRKPVAGVDAAGYGVVAWEAGDILDQPDGSCTAIFAQRIDPTGARIGSAFQVNTSGFGCQVEPQVAVQPDGSFLIAWSYANGYDPGVFARRFDASGTAQGGEFRIGSPVNAGDAAPALAVDGSGNYAFAWVSQNGLLFHRITATGAAVTPQVTVAGVTGRPSLAADPGGAVLVAWQQYDGPNGHIIMARHYDASGSPSGPGFRLNALPMQDSGDSDNVAINGEPVVIVLGSGRFAVIWADQSTPADAVLDLFGSIVVSPGIPVRGNFLFASRSIWGDPQDVRPTAARDSTGGAFLAWEHSYPTPAGSPWQSPFLRGVFMQHFAAFCPSTPVAGCLTATPQKGSIALKKGSDLTGDTLVWKWAKGAIDADDLGDPTTSTSFALCLYDGTGVLTVAATAPGGSLCKGGKPCWSRGGAPPVVKLKYSNTVKPALPGGISGMKLVSGTGKASLSLKGKGLNLYSVPTLPLDQGTPVRVQLINDANNVCWEASYSAPASATDAAKFKDKND